MENLVTFTRIYILHYQLETSQLQAEKSALQKQLKDNNKTSLGAWLWGFGGIFLVIATFFLRKLNNKKIDKAFDKKFQISKNASEEVDILITQHNYDELKMIETLNVLKNNLDNKEKIMSDHKEEIVSDNKELDRSKILTSTDKRLMKELKLFEAKKEFKRPITLEEMAFHFGTNRTTLSNFLNNHRGGYNHYLSKLRLSAVVADLEASKSLRKNTLQEISVLYGFPNEKAFSSQFKAEMNKSPLDYIKQLEKDKKNTSNSIEN
jgi:AraC-like DNA-binding protein